MSETRTKVYLNNYEIEVLLNALLDDCRGLEKNNEFHNYDTEIEKISNSINYLIDVATANKGKVTYSDHDEMYFVD